MSATRSGASCACSVTPLAMAGERSAPRARVPPPRAPQRAIATLTRVSDTAVVSTAAFGPGTIGPVPRPTDQTLWDPAHQAMDPGQRRDLQDERVRALIG